MSQEYEEFTAAEELTNTKGENITVYKPQSLNMKELDSNNIPNSAGNQTIGQADHQLSMHDPSAKRKKYIMYPKWLVPWTDVARFLTISLILLACWGIAYSWLGEDAIPPKGQFFCLAILSLSSYVAGSLLERFTPVPPLLGMLLIGLLYRNVGIVQILGQYTHISTALRKMALAIILVRAGLGLDPIALRRLGSMVARLAILPGLIEIATITWASHLLLNLPWLWSLLLGCIMAAISPAVVIPCLFALQDKGYGRSKGVPTLIIAAASFDDVLAISAFGIALSILFASGDLTMQIIQGPIALVIGVVFGIIWGYLARYLPEQNDTHTASLRTLMIATGALLSIFGSEAIGFEGAGPLACIISAFIACYGWRTTGWSDELNPVADFFKLIWSIFQPILFALIGTEVDLNILDGNVVGLSIASISIGLVFRIIGSIFIAMGGSFNLRERIFISIAWFPKATVQAALGPIALDIVRNSSNPDPVEMDYAWKVLITAVLSILMTAPLGAIMITFFGPKLLTNENIKPPSNSNTVETAGVSSHL